VKLKQEKTKRHTQAHDAESAAVRAEHPDLQDPNVVLSLLEADQVVAAKTRTRFGKRNLSVGARLLLWGLRVYVFVMLVIVLISVIHALHGGQ
jgi:hypothetical protein